MPDFMLPDVGEGLTEADILKWLVRPGDTVEHNQVLVEVETAKAAVELPSPFAGVVAVLHAQEGDTVEVGRPIITIDTDGSGTAAAEQPTDDRPPIYDVPGEGQLTGEPKRQPVLVGYGPREGASRRRPRKTADLAPTANAAFNVPPPSEGPVADDELGTTPVVDDDPAAVSSGRVHAGRHGGAPSSGRVHVLAKPPVRKLAKSLGVDLATVAATGPNGVVTRADVERAAADTDPTEAAAPAPVARPTGRETRVPIRGVRKHTAAAMVSSAFTAPHVTEFITVDVTPMMELRDRVGARREFADVKVSPLLFVAKAVILAAKRTPEINATWDDAAQEIVLKHYVNLGIAAATDRGLVVPNVKDADQLSMLELARAIGGLTEVARTGRTTPADMSGGTITITNVGVFGVDTGTPILNPGETGIVAFGAVRKTPWVVDDAIVPRWVTQLAVSFDHRVVDGQQGSQFLADVAAVLADPGMALL